MGALKPPRQLDRRRRLSASLKPHHEDHRRGHRGDGKRSGVPHQGNELLVHHRRDMLRGADRLDDVELQRPLPYPGDEAAGHLEIDVRLQQGFAYLAKRGVNVRLRELPPASQTRKRGLQLLPQCVKHPLLYSLKVEDGKNAHAPPFVSFKRKASFLASSSWILASSRRVVSEK